MSVRLNWTWFILALLIIWTLAVGYFPGYDLDLSTSTYWIMAVVSLAGIVGSLVAHEYCHALLARRCHLGGKKITLFIFGGVADLEREPRNPGQEFWIAIVGPIFSAILAFVLALIDTAGVDAGWPTPVTDVLFYLSAFNYVIAVFNLVPAFPLDGGRVLRSILWRAKSDLRWATRIASNLGVAFGILIAIAGVFEFLNFNLVNGVWFFFLGIFLVGLARSSYRQVLMTSLLEHEPIERAMRANTFSVSPETSLKELAEDVYKYHTKLFPVTEGPRLLGCIGVRELRRVPELQWPLHTVSEYAEGCSTDNVVSPQDGVIDVLRLLKRTKGDELIVVDHGRLVGKVTSRDIVEFFNLKMEMEESA